MKNTFKLLLVVFTALCMLFSLVACVVDDTPDESVAESVTESESPSEESSVAPDSDPIVETFTIVFVDYDDTVISSAEYELGATVTEPETPVRVGNETFTYEFAGWDSEVVAVDGDKTYKATYTEIYVEYTIVFVSEGETLSSATYHYGDEVVVPALPTKDSDETYTYEFASWDAEVVAVAGNATYTATYTPTYIDYTVVFVDENEVELSRATYHYGDEVVVPDLPTKDADETYTYTYSWNQEVVAVAGDVTYVAVCTPVYIDYVIEFVDEDGTVISSLTYHYGDEVVEPSAPTKDADETYTYEFAGWDAEVVTVAGNATYTATYTPTYIDYTVVFVDENEVELSRATYHYGDEVVEYSEELTKDEDAYFTYEFAGWDKEITVVACDVKYTAVYTATAKAGYDAHHVSMQNEALVLGAGSIGDGADYAKGAQEGGYVDQAYFAIDGEYGLGDFLAFDFTGKNMPEVAFFAKNYDNSMYANGLNKQGVVVVSGITTYNGGLESGINNNGTQVRFAHPFMIQNAVDNAFLHGFDAENATSALGRANLVDGTHYRVVMGFVEGSSHGTNGITLKWYLYDLDTDTVVEEASLGSYNFFTGSAEAVNNMTLSDLVGSVVLYGKFGATTTIDKLHGVYNGIDFDTVKHGVGKTFTVNFKDANGEIIETDSVLFGGTPVFNGEIPDAPVLESDYFESYYAWNEDFTTVVADVNYSLVVTNRVKSQYNYSNVSTVDGTNVVLGAGGIGDGANYTLGQQNGGYVNQSYFALDGNYGLNTYVALDFTGKNLPEIAFFAKNYNNSMYAEGTSKQGVVVVTGITTYNGQLSSGVNGNGTEINYGYPYMIQNAADGGFCEGAFADSALGRATLVDGTHYRVIMGFTGSGNKITLHWYLYNLDTKTVVEQSSMSTWGFFTGANEKVGNMTLNDLVGSIVLYGKFGVDCIVDKIHGVYTDATIDSVAGVLNGAPVSDKIVLSAGSIGDGANYTIGQNNGGYVNQSYRAIDGSYGLDNYVVFDFTGKNMPEVAFFAKNHNNSMYAEGTSKQGVVVVTGITTYNGQLSSGVNGNGTQINYGFPYMIQDAANGGFCEGAFAQSALGRANLVDGTHYRVIMGFTGSGSAITLHWYLYNLDTKTVVEQSSMSTWGFFTGSNEKVGNMTLNDLVGSIVFYGKFGVDCTIDKLHGVESGALADVIAKYTVA